MRGSLSWLLPLLLLGCSNPPPPAEPAASAPATPAASPAVPATQTAPADPAHNGVDPLYAAVAADSDSPAMMLNRYVRDLLGGDQARSNAAWAVAPPDARRADDAALRALSGVRTLRLDSDVPLPRDEAQPPRLLEVPVQVRAVTAQGIFRYHGWYQVQPSADGQRWQIHSARLQPTLD